MKYLNLFEAKSVDESKAQLKSLLNELDSKTSVSSVIAEIEELFFDIKDEFVADHFQVRCEANLELKYTKKVNRDSRLSWTFYQLELKQPHRVSSENLRYLAGFIEKCKYGTSLTLNFRPSFYFETKSAVTGSEPTVEDLSRFETMKSMILDIMNRAEQLGYKVLGTESSGHFTQSNIDDAFEGVSDHITIVLEIKTDLDLTKFEKNPQEFKLPQNIISDFEQFVTQRGLTDEDKTELISILSKGKWN